MRQFFTILLLSTLILSCSSPKKEGNVSINGTVKGLKKGTLYLQKIKDTILINLDSLVIDGDPQFTFQTTVQEPEIHYLFLDKHDGTQFNDRIDFFAEPGVITINTSLNGFEKEAIIAGGKNQTKLIEYNKMNKRFKERNLRIIKEDYEAKKQNDDEKLAKNDIAYKNLLRQKYLYTINFAINNRKLEVAPYITLHEVFDANIKYLDTVAKSLSPKVKKSIYGKQLTDYLKERKTKEAERVEKDQ
ncbi:DUF4369 domain-containing protein [Aquimarina sp. MMG015]|uniref:DUF4369 domain-containing protein n=1 Tax=Aquimarina TaxID=290174 RepID=UPI0003FA99E6|nr:MULTISPECIES: DUF4369 domain-containing protein [Aquimarina]AXT58434.1 DUF4369 domain-containing protein [Aquimarina sp. AD1]MBQ4805720.1 DUF4369 domain-containing protein [Aquimarina sp. MMG015]RKN13259.1 DUF4369 domain-containing protein [Aquimarina sp. AD1]